MQKPFQGIQIHHSLLGMHYAIDYVCFTSALFSLQKQEPVKSHFFSWIGQCVKTTYKINVNTRIIIMAVNYPIYLCCICSQAI